MYIGYGMPITEVLFFNINDVHLWGETTNLHVNHG